MSEDILKGLDSQFSMEEIKFALFNMAPMKAPGPNGLHVVFLQSQWDIVGKSIYDLILKIVEETKLVRNLNETLLVLIPKTENPELMKQFRPISLCNVVFKIITKVLTNKIKPYMDHLVSTNQCSFISNRQSSDNVIMAQEIIHSMRKKKGVDGNKSRY